MSLNIALTNTYDAQLFSNNYNEVRRAIDLGADVDAVIRGSTPLYDAARKNNTQILNLLLNRNADPNKKSHGETPLHKVVQSGNVRLAEALLEVDADPNIKDDIRGNTPLQYAAQRYNPRMIAALVKYGGDIFSENKYGDTPARNILMRVSIPAMKVENDDLTVQSSPFSIAKGSVGLSAKNNTDKYIIVTDVALYVNGDLISQASVNRGVPPRSNSGIASLPITKDAYKGVDIEKDGTSDVKYGFAIRYKIDGDKETLYETTRSTLKLW